VSDLRLTEEERRAVEERVAELVKEHGVAEDYALFLALVELGHIGTTDGEDLNTAA
jgi:hypothetical protein